MTLAVLGTLRGFASARSPQATAARVEVLQVRPNFYLIAGAGSKHRSPNWRQNGVVPRGHRVRLNDDGRVFAEIKKLTDKPIRFIINTSADADHVGGNEELSQAGQSLIPTARRDDEQRGAAAILAQENVL